MKVRISDISPQGLLISDTIPLESLNDRMTSGQGDEIRFTSAPKADLTVRKTATGAELSGTIQTTYQQGCALCLKECDRDMKIDISYVLKEKPAADIRGPRDDFDDDIGIAYYENDHIDLEDLLQEELILALTIYWHPPVDASGKCTECGINPESLGIVKAPEKTKFGDLLKKAGIKSSEN